MQSPLAGPTCCLEVEVGAWDNTEDDEANYLNNEISPPQPGLQASTPLPATITAPPKPRFKFPFHPPLSKPAKTMPVSAVSTPPTPQRNPSDTKSSAITTSSATSRHRLSQCCSALCLVQLYGQVSAVRNQDSSPELLGSTTHGKKYSHASPLSDHFPSVFFISHIPRGTIMCGRCPAKISGPSTSE